LECHLCHEFTQLKSNVGIAEERARMVGELMHRSAPCCPDPTCANYGLPVGAGTGHYQGFGITRAGSQRYRCKACGKTFSVRKSTTGHKQPHKNKMIFALLMNKSPFRRISEVADIGPTGLYGKIDFLHDQCLAFAASRERRLLAGMPLSRLYLATDRQDYLVNWTQQQDRRNVKLHAMGTADNATGYVFGLHLNYDPSADPDAIERAAVAAGDYQSTPPFRRYARCWLRADYRVAAARGSAPVGN
jgi:hypothetical protein